MTPLLALRGVSKTYVRGASDRDVLIEASLDVHAGAFVAVFGGRSSGKTTLLKVAAGLERPDQGTVFYGGRDLNALSSSALASIHRTEIAWVDRSGPQTDELTMVDYIGLPLLRTHGYGAARRVALETLARVGASECAFARWRDLSDAERAQISIVHALARKPRLMVLDDPTAGLDLVERGRVLGLLRTTADESRCGVLMAVPDFPAMIRAHEVLALSGGRLISATPAQQAVVIDFPDRQRSV